MSINLSKVTDFNAIITVRFRNERTRDGINLNLTYLVKGDTLQMHMNASSPFNVNHQISN